jgi:hypothetical protein
VDNKDKNKIINKGIRRLGSFLMILFVVVLTFNRMEAYPEDDYFLYVNAILIVYGFIELFEFLGYVVEFINLSNKNK